MTRRSHPDATRARAFELLAQGRSVREVSEIIGVPQYTIFDWKRQPRQRVAKPKPDTEPKGSGVIAPRTYASGLLFPGGRGRYGE
jgi:transposase-like protein